MKNTTMRSANTFLVLFSFGNLIIEESHFINVRFSAIWFVFYADYITPNQTIIRNCLFEDGSSISIGAAFLYKGLITMRDQFSLNVLFVNTTFLNNQARSKIYTLLVTLLII